MKRGGRTGEVANHGLPFHLIASFSTEESCDVPEGCCCRLRWVSQRSGYCNRSSLIEPGWGANFLIYLRFDDVTGGATGSVPCLLPSPVFSHKMAPSPFKMAACENKMDAASGFQWDRATGPTVSLVARDWCLSRTMVHIVFAHTPASVSSTGTMAWAASAAWLGNLQPPYCPVFPTQVLPVFIYHHNLSPSP